MAAVSKECVFTNTVSPGETRYVSKEQCDKNCGDPDPSIPDPPRYTRRWFCEPDGGGPSTGGSIGANPLGRSCNQRIAPVGTGYATKAACDRDCEDPTKPIDPTTPTGPTTPTRPTTYEKVGVYKCRPAPYWNCYFDSTGTLNQPGAYRTLTACLTKLWT